MRFRAIGMVICLSISFVFGLQISDSASYDALILKCPRKTAWVHCSFTNDCRAMSVPEYVDLSDSSLTIYLELTWPYFIKKPKLLKGLACDSTIATLKVVDDTGGAWAKPFVFYAVHFPLPDSITKQWQSSAEFASLSSMPPKRNIVFKILDEKDNKDITSSSKISVYTRTGATDQSKANCINRCRQLFGSRLFSVLTKEISESFSTGYSPGIYKVDIFCNGYYPIHKDLRIDRNQAFVLRLKKIPAKDHFVE